MTLSHGHTYNFTWHSRKLICSETLIKVTRINAKVKLSPWGEGAQAPARKVWREPATRVKWEKENSQQLLFQEFGVQFAKTHTNLRVQSRREKNGASTELYQPEPPSLSPGKGTPAANLPHSKAGQAWRCSARKLRWDSAGTLARRTGLGSREDAALHWLELAGLTPPSARRRRPGTGNPHLQGTEAAGERFPCVVAPRGCSGGGLGASGPRTTCWRRDSPSVFTCRRGQERRSRWPPLAGRALSWLWRLGHQVELAPHVAGRASFTAQPGGGGAERARGSCDRRLASIGQAQPTSARARPASPLPAPRPAREG